MGPRPAVLQLHDLWQLEVGIRRKVSLEFADGLFRLGLLTLRQVVRKVDVGRRLEYLFDRPRRRNTGTVWTERREQIVEMVHDVVAGKNHRRSLTGGLQLLPFRQCISASRLDELEREMRKRLLPEHGIEPESAIRSQLRNI